MRIICHITLLLTLLGAPLRADDPVKALLGRSVYSPEESRRITDVFARAERERVPADMILPRLEEGLAKRVPANTLVPVLERELTSLVRARRVLESADERFDTVRLAVIWQRAALCLSAGIEEQSVREIARAAVKRWPDFREATELYLALDRWGLSREESLMVTIAALASRLEARDFSGVAALFSQGRTLYLSPRVIVNRIVRALPAVTGMEALAARVLY